MRKLLIIAFALATSTSVVAQDTLPRISVINSSNQNVISWTNPYFSLTTINIQRSYDSLYNFKTIGSVLDVNTKTNGFVDTKPPTGKQYYRLFLSFEGGIYIFSKSYRPVIDTSKVSVKEFKSAVVNTWFEPSKFVYTGRENNVIISLPLAGKKKYLVKFFEENGNFLFELAKITESYLTMDKVNFVHAGLFNFELYEDGLLIEKHKFYIPKDGKSQGLNEQGKPQR
jgi:hypothetical protein